jgi:anti-sigma B factor antagonist
METESKGLDIKQVREGKKLTCVLTGWLDPNTSPQLTNIDLTEVKELIFDMKGVEYVFSAGLRSVVMLQKLLDLQGGTIKLINLSDDVRNIFECTGLDSILEPKA